MSSARSNYSPCSAVNTRCCQFEDAALKEARNSVWLVLFFYFDSWLQSPAEVQVLEELYHHDGFCIRVPLTISTRISNSLSGRDQKTGFPAGLLQNNVVGDLPKGPQKS